MINLPRKLAPRSWSSYYGHKEDVHCILRSIIQDGDLFPNAFYISGDTGTGKTTLVNIIIRSLLCEDPQDYTLEDKTYPKVDPCGKCRTCQAITDFRDIESSYTNIKLVQHGKGDNETVDAAVNDALRLSMTPPVNFSPTRKDYRFLIFDEWQMFDKKQRQKVLLKAEAPLDTSIFIFITMAEDEINARRRTALVSRGLGIELHGFTEQEIATYLLEVFNPELPPLYPKLKEPEALAIARTCDNSLRMALSRYGNLFRYDYGLDFVRPSTAKYFLKYTDAEDRKEIWHSLEYSNWVTLNACIERFIRLYNPSRVDRLAIDLLSDITTAMRSGRGNREDQLLAINTLHRFMAGPKSLRIVDYLTVLIGLNLGVI